MDNSVTCGVPSHWKLKRNHVVSTTEYRLSQSLGDRSEVGTFYGTEKNNIARTRFSLKEL
jgi:hypothetical protein